LLLKDFCDSFKDSVPELDLSKYWAKIDELAQVLQPANDAIVKFQKTDLILSGFFKIWKNSMLVLDKMSNKHAHCLKEKLESRLNLIMSEPLIASLYLHPRYD
jgi:hypothetical protein